MRVQYLGRFRTLRKSLWRPGSRPDTVICYDVTKPTEIADFFAVSYAQHRIAMIHQYREVGGKNVPHPHFTMFVARPFVTSVSFNPNNSRSRITVGQLDRDLVSGYCQILASKKLESSLKLPPGLRTTARNCFTF